MVSSKPVDPRSQMTDRENFMSRSLHTPRIVSIVAIDIAQREGLTRPTDAVRRALRFLQIIGADEAPYDESIDPTMAKCVELTRKGMAAK